MGLVEWIQDHLELVVEGLRKVTYADDNGEFTLSYLAETIDDIRPEHQHVVALLDAMPLEMNLALGMPTARIWDESHKVVLASKSTWAGVSNYWIYTDDL